MATHVGVILDKNYLAAVRLEGSQKNLVISDYACELIPKQKEGEEIDPYSYRAKLLDNFLTKHHFPRLSLYLVVSSEFCMLRQFMVPFLSEDQIKKTVRFEAESHIHGATIEEIEIQHMKIGEIKNRSELVVYGIRREALNETLRALKKHQIEPIGIDTPTSAISNYFVNRPEAADENPELWVNIGAEDTTIAVINKENIKYLRELKSGFPLPTKFLPDIDSVKNPIAKVRAKHPKPESGEAIVMVANEELKPVNELESKYNPTKLVEKLALEIKRTFVSFPALDIKTVRISGAGLVLDEIIARLKTKFPEIEINACRNSLFKTKENALENTTLGSQAMAVTIGAALKGFNLNKLNVEFRQGEFALRDAFEVLKTPLSIAVVLLMLLFLTFFIYVLNNKKELENNVDTLYSEMQHIFEETYKVNGEMIKKFPEDEDKLLAIENAFGLIKSDYNKLSNAGSQKGLPKVHSVVDVLREIFINLDKVGREEASYKNKFGMPAPTRKDPSVPDPKFTQRFKLEFSVGSIVIDNNLKRDKFVIDGRCKDSIAIVNAKNKLNDDKEWFRNVEFDVSEITNTEEERRGRVFDTRPTFKLEGEIVPAYDEDKKKE